MPPHKFRGKAGGVSVHSQLPSRKNGEAPDNDWVHTTRVLHTVIRLGSLWVQLVVLDWFASNKQSRRASANALLAHALDLTSRLPIPEMFLGDYNLDLSELDELPAFQDYSRAT